MGVPRVPRLSKAAAAGVVLLTFLAYQANRSPPHPAGLATPAYTRRTVRYCNSGYGSAEEGAGTGVRGEEGRLSVSREEMILLGVTMTVRHGDRSAIHAVPGAVTEAVFNCSGFPRWQDNLQVVSEETGQVLASRPTSPVTLSNPPGACAAGQLTPVGHRQLRSLGSFIRHSYADRVPEDISSFYARSTDYGRTILSGAGFFSGFFRSRWAAGASTPFRLHVHEEETAEAMHGVGLRSSSVGASLSNRTAGEEVVVGGCRRAVLLATRQKAAFRRELRRGAVLRQHVATLFGGSAAERDVTDLGDALHAGACHGLSLPCGPGGCLPANVAADLLHYSDSSYCNRYTGGEGGGAASRLAIYPFLLSISDGLQAVADGRSSVSWRFYFGHDTVVAPVLAALGAFDCRWPPYASRVVFELWRNTVDSGHSVRLLYNGLPMKIRGCSGQDPCPLARFRRVVHGLIAPKETLKEACEEGS